MRFFFVKDKEQILFNFKLILERLNIKFVSKPKAGLLSIEEKEKIKNAQDKHRSYLQIPRR